MQVSIRILYPSSRGRQDTTPYLCDAWCNFFLTLHSFGDQIQQHSDPSSKSLLGILRDLRIITDVLANMNQSRVEVFAWGDFPNACADLVTLFGPRIHIKVIRCRTLEGGGYKIRIDTCINILALECRSPMSKSLIIHRFMWNLWLFLSLRTISASVALSCLRLATLSCLRLAALSSIHLATLSCQDLATLSSQQLPTWGSIVRNVDWTWKLSHTCRRDFVFWDYTGKQIEPSWKIGRLINGKNTFTGEKKLIFNCGTECRKNLSFVVKIDSLLPNRFFVAIFPVYWRVFWWKNGPANI
jgi:hypothetical protein